MRHRIILFAFLASSAGCTTQVVDPAYHYDAVERALETPFYYMPVSGYDLENGQSFDAAVALFQLQGLDGKVTSSAGQMAFESNGTPAQVDSAIIDGVDLPWAPYTYSTTDSALDDGADSVTFEYKNFGGESFAQSVSTVPNFGTVIFPDTISTSQGFRITYEHSNPKDSLSILSMGDSDAVWLTPPDTGSIVLGPHQLAPSNRGYSFIMFRWNWTTRTSPSGKKIGIYSSVETPWILVPSKP